MKKILSYLLVVGFVAAVVFLLFRMGAFRNDELVSLPVSRDSSSVSVEQDGELEQEVQKEFVVDEESALQKEAASQDEEVVAREGQNENVLVPERLLNQFPDTDWSRVDASIEGILSGGPPKDGIPAIDDPKFESISSFKYSDDIRAIVMKSGGSVRVYPYNILTWHEIVNDEVDGVPVAVTFCPLCGSAIVYDRTLSGGASTFGVSGFLLESNMVMYDRATESLWQQSTGKALAGTHLGKELPLVPFQLLTIGEVKEKYSNALVLSDKTGYIRSYGLNPYSGYEEEEGFIFNPSVQDARYPSKEIFVVLKDNKKVLGVPWLHLREGKYETSVTGSKITLEKKGAELFVKNAKGEGVPFYFEMWFSFAVQNPEGVVFDPES